MTLGLGLRCGACIRSLSRVSGYGSVLRVTGVRRRRFRYRESRRACGVFAFRTCGVRGIEKDLVGGVEKDFVGGIGKDFDG